jgi:hypothetical protein
MRPLWHAYNATGRVTRYAGRPVHDAQAFMSLALRRRTKPLQAGAVR